MLIWLLNAAFDVVDFLLGLWLFILPIFYILRMMMPQNKYVLLAGKYLGVILAPMSIWLRRTFSKWTSLGFDMSPTLLWLLTLVLRWALRLLQSILL